MTKTNDGIPHCTVEYEQTLCSQKVIAGHLDKMGEFDGTWDCIWFCGDANDCARKNFVAIVPISKAKSSFLVDKQDSAICCYKDNLEDGDAIGKYASTDIMWKILAALENSTPDWRAFLKLLAKGALPCAAVGDDAPITQKLYNQMHAVLAAEDAEGWTGHIDAFDGFTVSGWAKKTNCNDVQPINILANGHILKSDFKEYYYREDLVAAGIGNGCYGYAAQFQWENLSDEFIIVALQDSVTKKIFAWKCFPAIDVDKDFEFKVTAISPKIQGYCIWKKNPSFPVEIRIEIDGVHLQSLNNNIYIPEIGQFDNNCKIGGFECGFTLQSLYTGRHIVKIMAYGGRLSQEYGLDTVGTEFCELDDMSILDRQISIIIPYYNDPCVYDCLQAVLKFTDGQYRIIIVDDRATAPTIEDALGNLLFHPLITIIHNQRNMGFSSSVNVGIRASGNDDIILLNQDALVTPYWLQSMLLTAARFPKVATVTPMSDRAGAFSAPRMGNDNVLPSGADRVAYSLAFRRASFRLMPLVPTGNGFCMYVNRSCINAIGPLNNVVFARLYGEENDFCMRAVRAGWLNLVDDKTYVYHMRNESSSSGRQELMKQALGTLSRIYPEYTEATKIFGSSREFWKMRFAGALAQATWRKLARVRLLYVMGVEEGGTACTNMDLMSIMSMMCECFLLVCNASAMKAYRIEGNKRILFFSKQLEYRVEPVTHVSPEYDKIAASLIHNLAIDIVHVRLILRQSMNIILIAKKLGCKVLFSFHDFYAISPNLYLIDEEGKFNGAKYANTPSIYRTNHYKHVTNAILPVHNSDYVAYWRERMSKYLLQCDAWVTTSDYTRAMLRAYLPKLPQECFYVIPHGRSFACMRNLLSPYLPGEKIRLLAPGNLDYNKGKALLEELAEYDANGCGMMEIVSLGHYSGTCAHIKSCGPYERDNLPAKVEQIRPHAALILSIWSETWCHTLTEMWALGIPVFVLDFGTQAWRVSQSGAGWILPMGAAPDLHAKILEIMQNQDELERVVAGVTRWQKEEGTAHSTSLMALRYYMLYCDLLAGNKDGAGATRHRLCAVLDQRKPGIGKEDYMAMNSMEKELALLHVNPHEMLAILKMRDIDQAIIYSEGVHEYVIKQCLQISSKNNIECKVL